MGRHLVLVRQSVALAELCKTCCRHSVHGESSATAKIDHKFNSHKLFNKYIHVGVSEVVSISN